jgi:hypothetical protein
MWNMKCMITSIPVITGVTGIVKRFKKKLEAINRKTFNRFGKKKRQLHITQSTENTAV